MNCEGKRESKSEGQSVTKPTVAVTVTRDQIEQLRDQGQQVAEDANLVKNYDIGSKATKGHPIPSFDDLRPQDRVKASDVWASLNKPLFGKFYLCQTIGPAMDMGGISVPVTDPQGHDEDDETVGGIELVLYNYSSIQQQSGLRGTLDEILPIGSFLVLKNPLLKQSPEGSLIWTCENPAEVQLLSMKRVQSKFPDVKWDPENPKKGALFYQKKYFWMWVVGDKAAFAKLKRFGNIGFVNKRFSDAIRFYDMALDYCGESGEDRAMIQSNKSAALLGLGCFNAALKCADLALEVDPGNDKYNYRKTKALIGLKNYEEALGFLEKKFDQFSSLRKSKDCKKLLENVKFLCSRKSLGPTESQLISLHMMKIEDSDKIPEFTGPLALVSQMEGKDRGLVATQDIRPGQLVICAKAFSFGAIPPASKSTPANAIMEKFNQLDLGFGNNSVAHKPCKEQAVTAIANKLAFDPELRSEFYKLTAGRDLGHLEPMDTKTGHVDMERVKEILRINSFDSDRCEEGKSGEFAGLWILPSFFNHSCSEYNCLWAICGEWMTVKAIAEIKKGEELTLAYKSPIINHEERQCYFTSLGFTCNCKLCQLETKEPKSVKNERAKILKNLDELASNSGLREIKLALKGVEKLISFRKDNVGLNFPILSPQIIGLIEILICKARFGDAISVLGSMFEVVSASVRWHDGIYVATNMIGCHAARRDKDAVKMWIATLKRLGMKFYGSLELFRVKEFKEAVTVQLLQRHLGMDFFQDD